MADFSQQHVVNLSMQFAVEIEIYTIFLLINQVKFFASIRTVGYVELLMRYLFKTETHCETNMR